MSTLRQSESVATATPLLVLPTAGSRGRRIAALGLVLSLGLFGCSGEKVPPSSPTKAQATPAAAAPSGKSSDVQGNSTGTIAAAQKASVESGERYSPGLQTLETSYDLSSLASDQEIPVTAADGDEHAGHNHAAGEGHDTPAQPSAETQPGGLAPAGMRYLGGISLAEGEKKSHDFGLIREGESREKTFKFLSDGEEPLVIKAVKPSCGCTKADIMLVQADGARVVYEKGTEIAAGQPFELDTAISTENKHGAFGTSVSIYTNAPGGAFNIKLEAAVEPVLEVTPQSNVFLGQMTTADVMDEELTVKSTRGELFTLATKEETLPEELRVTLTPVEPNAEGLSAEWKVVIQAGPGLPVGVRNYPCALVSSIEVPSPKYATPEGGPKFYTLPVAVQARVTGMVNATPAFVGFGLVRPGQEVERSLRLECFDDFALTSDIKVELAGLYGGEFEHLDRFTVNLEPLEDGKLLDVHVKLTGLPEDATGSFGGILKISVGHPDMDEIQVRFSGVCRAGAPARQSEEK